MDSKRVRFENATGQTLSGVLELPGDQNPLVFAVFAHCFTCSKDIKPAVNISQALAEQGIGVLRFDFTGLGQSEGEFADSNFTSNVDDLVAAAEFLDTNFEAPRILVGHSLGGTAVLQAASRVPSATAVATIAAPSEPSHLAGVFAGSRDEIEAKGEVEVTIGGQKFKIKKQMIEDLESTKMKQTIAGLQKALIVFHSPADSVVGIDHASKIFKAARHPKSYVSLDGADHLLLKEADSRYVGSVIAVWASRYISQVA